jgi:hypothetical protein
VIGWPELVRVRSGVIANRGSVAFVRNAIAVLVEASAAVGKLVAEPIEPIAVEITGIGNAVRRVLAIVVPELERLVRHHVFEPGLDLVHARSAITGVRVSRLAVDIRSLDAAIRCVRPVEDFEYHHLIG